MGPAASRYVLHARIHAAESPRHGPMHSQGIHSQGIHSQAIHTLQVFLSPERVNAVM